MNNKGLIGLGIVAVVALFGICGNMDFEDEAREHLLYCNNVKDGLHPDYRNFYDSGCTPEEIERISKFLR